MLCVSASIMVLGMVSSPNDSSIPPPPPRPQPSLTLTPPTEGLYSGATISTKYLHPNCVGTNTEKKKEQKWLPKW